jgi:hypothetical protein
MRLRRAPPALAGASRPALLDAVLEEVTTLMQRL